MSLISEGNNVLLYLDRKRTYLVKVEAGKNFHTHKGFIQLANLIDKPYGTPIISSLNIEFIALKPTLQDYIYKSTRKTQIMYPKDIALIAMFSNIGPSSIIVEAGTGTGALTTALAYYAKPTGHVYSYETRQEFIETAQKNLEKAGVAQYVTIKNKDITESIEETEVDTVILDLATPWLVIPHAQKALKGSAVLVAFSPTIDQVIKTVEALKEHRFTAIETIECLMRKMQVERGKTRPETLMTAHTGYITHARKTQKREGREEEPLLQ